MDKGVLGLVAELNAKGGVKADAGGDAEADAKVKFFFDMFRQSCFCPSPNL